MQIHNRSEQILRPANRAFILLTLGCAALLNFLPTREWPGMPDWVALVLCIWSVREYRLLGMGTAFLMGMVMDVADAAVLGQHALAYVFMVFGASELSSRIMWFGLSRQGLQVFPLLVQVPLIQALVRYLAGDGFPDWTYFLGPFLSALLWMPMTLLLVLPQLRPYERDDNRPI